MAQLDPDSVGGMEHLARRLRDDGYLRKDVTLPYATNVFWMLLSFESFDLLLTDRGLSVDAAADLIIKTAERALCEF